MPGSPGKTKKRVADKLCESVKVVLPANENRAIRQGNILDKHYFPFKRADVCAFERGISEMLEVIGYGRRKTKSG